MSINHPNPTPTILHPAWCAPDAHHYVGTLDDWHRSDLHVHECNDSRRSDRSAVEVSVEQYSSRHGGEWVPNRPTILLHQTRELGADLTPSEARIVARRLLAAADIADGVAVTW